MRGPRGRAAASMLIDLAVPLGLFYVLHALGVSTFAALLTSAVVPALSSVYRLIRHREVDGLGIFIVGVAVVSALAALVGGSPRFLLAKDGVVTGLSGIWLLVTARADRPVTFQFARILLEGRVGPAGESWDELWERLPGFRRIWRNAAVIWGLAVTVDAAARFAMAYLLPVTMVPALNGALWIALFVVLQVVTNVYYRRAGLYDPRSTLYAPLHSGGASAVVDTTREDVRHR